MKDISEKLLAEVNDRIQLNLQLLDKPMDCISVIGMLVAELVARMAMLMHSTLLDGKTGDPPTIEQCIDRIVKGMLPGVMDELVKRNSPMMEEIRRDVAMRRAAKKAAAP